MDAQAANEGATPGAERKKPGIDESLRELNAARREAIGAARGAASALRDLAAADFALARSAVGRSLAWAGVAALLGTSAWLLLTAALVAALHALGLEWVWSLLIVAVAYLGGAGLCAWRMRSYLQHMGMQATRRQLSRMRAHKAEAPEPATATAPGTAPATAQGAE